VHITLWIACAHNSLVLRTLFFLKFTAIFQFLPFEVLKFGHCLIPPFRSVIEFVDEYYDLPYLEQNLITCWSRTLFFDIFEVYLMNYIDPVRLSERKHSSDFALKRRSLYK